ncbi:hypothetical protein ACEPPN_018867 [Leptodophora sp. 'Broadleaf-Isolate-01']
MRPLYFGLLGLCTTAASVSPLVDVGYSKYQGTKLLNGITQWLGIRYAAPPVGDLRFRAARDPIVDHVLHVADEHGPSCLPTGVLTISNTTSEDCLFLDVYAPSDAQKETVKGLLHRDLLPVYIFIQGGGFNSNANPNFNGSGLITASGNNIVIVTFNYRVGPYGFLASKEVKRDGDLNVGLKDQRKVFQWVQRHISKFGGDPNHVTIGGDSAGAASVDLHLSAYNGRDDGLFHAAAAESQSFGIQYTIEGSQYQYDALVSRTWCNGTVDTLACLRKLSAAEIQAVNINIAPPGTGLDAPLYMYSNIVDGDFTPDFTYNQFAQGKFLRVPVIFGADTNDGTGFTPKDTNSTAAMNGFLSSQFPTLSTTQLSKIDTLYPMAEQFPNSGLYWRAAANAYGDMRYKCPGLYISNAFAEAGVNSWNYRYNVEDPSQVAQGLGVPHTIELVAIWGPEFVNPVSSALSYSTPLNGPSIELMQGYWTSFIRSKNPNTYRADKAPLWEMWGEKGMNRILLETNTTRMETISQAEREKCGYLISIGAELQQ